MKKFRKICLVEDDKIQVFLISKFIERTDLAEKFSNYNNGKIAYDAMKECVDNRLSLPDIIFLDLNMPVWDGWEFYEAFITLPGSEKVLIFILTSSVSEYDVNKALKFGLENNYLSKPLGYSALEKLLKELPSPKS